jgi:feruloyl esterase
VISILACVILAQACAERPDGESHDRNASAATAQRSADPAEHCSSFARFGAGGLTIDSVSRITDREDLPEFCAIRGTIDPDIGFEARFPLEDWNGKYYQAGCGGYCGSLQPDKEGASNSINAALKKGFATITTDGGHRAWIGDASWAEDNPVAVEVYAHQLIPLTHRAGSLLVREYYGYPARLDYFGGCSNGGRLAAMAAQRYPELFDGILGGGAVLNLSFSGGVFGSWVVQANSGPEGERILNRANFAHKLPLLEQAVLAQCDGSDGRLDGVISQPRNCAVDVGLLPRCGSRGGDQCFTEQELAVIGKWYQGPRDSTGRQLFPGMPAGSERYWVIWFLDAEGQTAPGNGLGGDYAKYLGFEGGAPEDFTALDFDFDTDPARLEASGRMLNATDPDLDAFKAAGGKYLLWHGWQDPLVLPDQTVAWYEAIVDHMGGVSEVAPFMRLFMIPGMGHCWELPSASPDRFDPIAVLDAWVERGEPPRQLHVTALDPATATVADAVVCPYQAAPLFLEEQYDSNEDYCPSD